MSERYPGGIITKSTTTPTGPYQSGTAPGIWTLDQQLQFQQQGIWPTAGLLPNYIEDVFSTYLYTGNSSTQTITNGIDLSTKGGAVFFGGRNVGTNKSVYDTARGATYDICTNLDQQQYARTTALTGFTTSGFTLGSDAVTEAVNLSGTNYVSWTFRKQAKFFDIVTYTGTGSATTIAHNLGSVPGCIIVKRTDTTGNWQVYHSGLTSAAYSIQLNLTNAQASATTIWNSTAPTSSVFSVGTDATVNASGGTYVAYLFASNAGGFGSAGTDNVITCGSYTGNGSATGPTVTLGYEPQFLMVKLATTAGTDWFVFDNMRGFSLTSESYLKPNLSNAEATLSGLIRLTATGFTLNTGIIQLNQSGDTYIYIAIRRGPMATPTVGTSVFSPVTYSGNSTARTITGTNNPLDLSFITTIGGADNLWNDRLRGAQQTLYSNYTSAEGSQPTYVSGMDVEYGETLGTANAVNGSGNNYISEMFSRAPGFFDEVCYTGTSSNGGATATFNHNLGVVPEMIIVKLRAINGASGYTSDWFVYTTALNATYGYPYNAMYLNSSAAFSGVGMISSAPTTTTFTLEGQANVSPATYVAYLFATCPGVSKVGSYTGNGTTQTINCGFGAGGARFLLVKRTDSTSNWYCFDSSRGFTSSSSPYWFLNTNTFQSSGNNDIYAASTGFTIGSGTALNINAGTYIFLAIA